METNTVIPKVVNDISKTVNEQIHTHVNAGGCGVFAYLFASELIKCGYTPKISILTRSDKDGFDKAIMFYEKGKLNEFWGSICTLSIIHIVVEIDSLYIDSNGIYDEPRKSGFSYSPYVYETENIKFLKTISGNSTCWNEAFDRSYILKMAKIIKNCFKKHFN